MHLHTQSAKKEGQDLKKSLVYQIYSYSMHAGDKLCKDYKSHGYMAAMTRRSPNNKPKTNQVVVNNALSHKKIKPPLTLVRKHLICLVNAALWEFLNPALG